MIHVKWGRDVLHFPCPPLDTPLGDLRRELAAYTQLPVGSFKLVYKGAVMKEDGVPLSTYKLKENATIALIGGGHTSNISEPPPSPGAAAIKSTSTSIPTTTTKPPPPTEASTIHAIRAELERVRTTLVPDVDAFVRALALSSAALKSSLSLELEQQQWRRTDEDGSHDDPRSRSQQQQRRHSTLTLTPTPTPTPLDHTRLSELLLQSLLRLDALHVSGADWPEARMQRKAAVREVQEVLDRLDGAWAAAAAAAAR